MFAGREWATPINRFIPNAPLVELWENITMISDLNSLYIFEIGERKFFFFGDQHDSKSAGNCSEKFGIKCDDYNNKYSDGDFYGGKCTSIGILLRNWFIYNKDHKIQTDFYSEAAFTKSNARIEYGTITRTLDRLKYTDETIKHQFDDKSWLILINSLMEPCFVREKRSCPYHPYIHAHYTDVRKYDEEFDMSYADPFILYDIREYLQENMPRDRKNLLIFRDELLIIMSIIIQDYREILDGIMQEEGFEQFLQKFHNMSNSFSRDFGKLYIRKFENMRKLTVVRDKKMMHRTAGEIYRLRKENKFLANLIEDFIYNKADELAESVKEHFNEQIDILNNFENIGVVDMQYELIEIFSEFLGSLVRLSALSMDAYLLARMFLQTESKEILVYAGSAHISHYAEFFNVYLGVQSKIGVPTNFTNFDDIDNLGNRCVQSNDLPKYLDANKYRTYVTNKKYNIK
jgi:hypothetical protein